MINARSLGAVHTHTHTHTHTELTNEKTLVVTLCLKIC